MFKRALIVLLTAVCVLQLGACGGRTKPKSEVSLLGDPGYKNGFVVSPTGKGNEKPGGRDAFDYMGTASGAYWNVSQHSCNKSLYNGTETFEDGFYTYTDAEEPDDVAKTVRVNPTTGEISLNMLTSRDYTAPRQGNEAWCHLLIDTGFSGVRELFTMEKLTLDISFTFTQMDNRLGNDFVYNLHTAQFQLYFVIGTNNTRDGKQQFWFGVPFFDYREKSLKGPDGALDAYTQMYISSMGNEDIMEDIATVGERVDISVDLKPYIQETLLNAQAVGFMTYSSPDDLYLVNMNLGWECPGTFDVGVDIHNFDLIAKLLPEYVE